MFIQLLIKNDESSLKFKLGENPQWLMLTELTDFNWVNGLKNVINVSSTRWAVTLYCDGRCHLR